MEYILFNRFIYHQQENDLEHNIIIIQYLYNKYFSSLPSSIYFIIDFGLGDNLL